MSIRTLISFVVSVLVYAEVSRAQPFSVTVPGRSISDEAVTIVAIDVPPGLDQVEITELEIGGFSHPLPADIEVFLVNPLGAFAEIMTDRGGVIAVSALTLIYADDAVGVPPEAGPLASGRYRPEGLHEGSDPGLASLSTSMPTTDSWLVLIVDDSAGGAGAFESITLRGVGVPAAVPAVSEWGLAVLTLAGLIAGTISFRRSC